MTSEPDHRPVEIKAPHGAEVLEIRWGDGTVAKLPHAVLRGYCPCAGCQGHSGAIEFHPGGNLVLRDLEQVGNYALQLTWGDGHDSGIFSFRYLRQLGNLVREHGGALPEKVPTLPRS